MKIVLAMLFGLMCAAAGVLFRPFWLSQWGPYAFIFLAWLTLSVGLGWGGKGKPYSIRFGLICGTAITLVLLVVLHISLYVGLGVLLALIYLGIRTNFFGPISDQVQPNETE